MPGPLRVGGRLGTDVDAGQPPEEWARAQDPDRATVLDAGVLRVAVTGGGAQRIAMRRGGLIWTAAPFAAEPALAPGQAAHEHDAATAVVDDDGHVEVATGPSGASPLYVAAVADGAHFGSRIAPLVAADERQLTPDWDAWAHVLAVGAPLEGRTPFEEIRRLTPWQRLQASPSTPAHVVDGSWAWLDLPRGDAGTIEEVLAAVEARIARLAQASLLGSTLSGGWDSRVLASLAAAANPPGRTPAWTTASDTGTALDELVATQVASHLGLRHTLVPAEHHRFRSDLERYASLVDHQSSFHVWAMPLTEALRGEDVTVLDGLGGGIFLNDAFRGDGSPTPSRDARFADLARYLGGARRVLRPEVTEQITARTRAAFDDISSTLDGHPHERALLAYRTRTWPGIAHGVFSLVGDATSVATPFLDEEVVRAAASLPADERRDGKLYRSLLHRIRPELAELPTASQLTGPDRQLPRRGASRSAAATYRELLQRDPIRELVDPSLLAADLPVWCDLLGRTRPQHLIRSLAVLALWIERYGERLGGRDVSDLLSPVG